MQQLRGYWESLPAESPHRGRYAPPGEPGLKFWAAMLAIGAGIWLAVTGAVLIGLLVVVGGLVWGAVMAGQQRAYEMALAAYNRSVVCLAGYHVFAP
ncbi:hypothetical protein KEF29_03345 [Streptomyces tuirus]|uniref:Uncharacterized protein n=1 Tax=Streptomyces tuirus TaxID=68278 RepID=A0A941J0I4_9ACTN|nr:hypothetical protein [Streptomyces tuirus]